MKYTATGKGNRHFEIADEQQKAVGKLDYETWSANKAKASVWGNVYEMAPQGFWRTTIGVTRNGQPIATLKAKMGSQIVFSFDNGTTLLFKKKSLWSSSYVVLDASEREVAIIDQNFKWKGLSFNYEIEIYTNNLDSEVNTLLPFLLVYGSKYMRMRHSAVH